MFLKSVVKRFGQGYRPAADGWYLDLVFHVMLVLQSFKPTIADVHTCVGAMCPAFTLEVGTGMPNLMLLSVKNDCGTKAYIGPVFSYFEFLSDHRWNDEEWILETGEAPARPEWMSEILR